MSVPANAHERRDALLALVPTPYPPRPHRRSVICKGGFGTVLCCSWDGVDVAVKCVDAKNAACALSEAAVFARLKRSPPHANIVRLLHPYSDERGTCFVLELAVEDLLGFASRFEESRVPHDVAQTLASDMAAGVAHLHELRIAHRDLKLENFLLCADPQRAVVADFGLSFLSSESVQGALVSDRVGSRRCVAPEIVLTPGKYNPFRSDVFSLGACYFGLLCGFYPMDFEDARRARALVGLSAYELFEHYRRPVCMTAEQMQCVDAMLHADPASRPAVHDLFAMPWLAA